LREVDLVRVKGRKQPVRIYELLGNSEASLPKDKEESLSHFAAGLEAYRQQFWQEALGLFKQSLTLLPEDGPSRVMAERCQLYQEAPPPEEWDGVFVMTTK
jgi:adenylate cyclase